MDSRGTRKYRWMGRAAPFAILAALMAPARAGTVDKVEVSAKTAGAENDLLFKWPSAVEASARIEGRTLTISFARPFEADVGHVADVVAGYGRFVRLSADGKTLSIALTRALDVAAEKSETGWTVRLAAPGTFAAVKPDSASVSTAPITPEAPKASAPEKVASATPPAPVGNVNAKAAGAKTAAKRDTKAGAKPEAKPEATAEVKADAAPAPPSIAEPELTVSEGQDYTRLSFEWPAPVEYSAELAEGELKLVFKSDKPVRLSDLRVTPPKRVRDAVGALENGAFTAHIKVEPGVTLRQAQDGNYVIVDLVGPPAAADASKPAADQATFAPPAVLAVMAAISAPPPSFAALNAPGAALAPNATPAELPKAPPPKLASPDTIKSLMSLNDIDLSVLDERLNGKPEDNVPADLDPAPAPEGETAALADPEPFSVAVAPSVAFAMNVGLDSRTIKLGFPWGQAVPAAVVRRGDRLWIAFAREGAVDVSTVERVRAEGIVGAQVYAVKGATVIGLKLADHLLATAIPDAGGWTIALGDAILTPTPDIPLEKRITDKAAEVAAKMPGSLAMTHFRDPDVGDDIVFVMAGSPARGFVSTRHFVDFELLAATQGLVVRPISEGIDVRLDPDYAVITSGAGLHIAGTNLISPGGAKAVIDTRPSPAQMKFAEWRGAANVPFTKAYQSLLQRVAAAEDAERPDTNIDLAHFMLGYGLYEEALGALKVAADEAPQIVGEPQFRVLRGVASLLADRPKEAKADLDAQELPDDPDTSLWVAMLASAEQDYPRARIFFTKAEPAIVRLDNEWQAKTRLRAAEAGLEINDFGWARDVLDLMPSEGLNREQADEAKLLRARLTEATGDPAKAASAYGALSRSPIEPIAVKAQLAGALLAARAGKLSTNEAIDKLEALRFEWRGDATEAQTLLALGQLYAKVGDYRHALSTMRIAVRQFPGTPTERRVYQEMADLFEELFLRGKADKMPPIQSLALYFDFKELTPVGPKGDVMIRRLSDRLVAMDLLDQATQLLKHQVDNRLSGVARSQVAAKLALVQLMNHKAEDALVTINNTRQARLPDDISMQRRLIEARALMDLKRYEHALDVVSGDSGPTVDRLRADIYWHAEDWGHAGPALEQGLGQAYGAAQPLGDAQRFDTMRAAISYALGNDAAGLARVKQEYASKMHETPDSHAFDVVTSAPGQGSVELYSLAEKFAGIDTLADFLGQVKDKDEAKIN